MQTWLCKEEECQVHAVQPFCPYACCVCGPLERQQYAAEVMQDLGCMMHTLRTALDFQRVAGPLAEAAIRRLVQDIEHCPLNVVAEAKAFARLPDSPQAVHMLNPVRPSLPPAPCCQPCAGWR